MIWMIAWTYHAALAEPAREELLSAWHRLVDEEFTRSEHKVHQNSFMLPAPQGCCDDPGAPNKVLTARINNLMSAHFQPQGASLLIRTSSWRIRHGLDRRIARHSSGDTSDQKGYRILRVPRRARTGTMAGPDGNNGATVAPADLCDLCDLCVLPTCNVSHFLKRGRRKAAKATHGPLPSLSSDSQSLSSPV